MEEQYKDWYKSRKNHVITLGLIALLSGVGAGISYNSNQKINEYNKNSLENKSCIQEPECKKETNGLYLGLGYISFLALVMGLSCLGTNPGDP